MPSFGSQIEASRRTNLAVRALEASSHTRVLEAVTTWINGGYTAASVRWALEAIVRDAYRSAAAVGIAHIAEQAGVPRWKPRWMPSRGPMKSPYLDGLVADVQRNLRDYKASPGQPEDLVRVVSRISHSAGVAAARGQTDALLRSAKELTDSGGFILRKVWQANFINHVPCELCADLHDTEAALEDEFPADNRLKVYGDLKGPPRHPRCMCHLVILVVGLENYLEEAGDVTEDVSEPQTMTTAEVKKIRPGFLASIMKWLRKLESVLRSGFDD